MRQCEIEFMANNETNSGPIPKSVTNLHFHQLRKMYLLLNNN